MNTHVSNRVLFGSVVYPNRSNGLTGSLESHLPLKKRYIRHVPPQEGGALPAVPWYRNPSPLHVVSSNEADCKPISPSSFSVCSSASEISSVDSGFCDIEPLDLSCNSAASLTSKGKSPKSTFLLNRWLISPLFILAGEFSAASLKRSVSSSGSPFSSTRVFKSSLMCPECGKVYESNSRFRAHLRRHDSKRTGRYQCGVCSKNFVQRSSLKTHERIHTGERPYHCQLCNQRFGDFSTFTKHRRTHTGEKPYTCPVAACGRSFSQSGNMHRHLKVVHKPHLDLYRDWCRALK